MKVIDNFVSSELADYIEKTMIGDAGNFPWYYNTIKTFKTQKTQEDLDNYQFTHVFFRDHKVWSEYFDKVINPFIPLLNIAAFIRVKANLNPRTHERLLDAFHIDISDDISTKTAIYYVNNNDGQTVFKSGEKIDSIKNRMVVFDANILHAGTTCTDKKVRCIINFNYLEWGKK